MSGVDCDSTDLLEGWVQKLSGFTSFQQVFVVVLLLILRPATHMEVNTPGE